KIPASSARAMRANISASTASGRTICSTAGSRMRRRKAMAIEPPADGHVPPPLPFGRRPRVAPLGTRPPWVGHVLPDITKASRTGGGGVGVMPSPDTRLQKYGCALLLAPTLLFLLGVSGSAAMSGAASTNNSPSGSAAGAFSPRLAQAAQAPPPDVNCPAA